MTESLTLCGAGHFERHQSKFRTVHVPPPRAAPQSSWTAGAGPFSAEHGCGGGTRAAGTGCGPRRARPALPLLPVGRGPRGARMSTLCPAGKSAIRPRGAEGFQGSRRWFPGPRRPRCRRREALGTGRGRRLRLPLVTAQGPVRPPSCEMAAVESGDSEEEDLVSYGSALQPLQEGKGPPRGSSAPPASLCQSLWRALESGPASSRRACAVRSGPVRFAAGGSAVLPLENSGVWV